MRSLQRGSVRSDSVRGGSQHKCLSAPAEANAGGAVLAFDATNAFNKLPRATLLQEVRARAPELFATAQAWLGQPTTHLFWNDDDVAVPVRAQQGVDQGCPLSPALFAIGIAGALEEARAQLQTLAPEARLFSYLDDVMVFVPAPFAGNAIDIVIVAFEHHQPPQAQFASSRTSLLYSKHFFSRVAVVNETVIALPVGARFFVTVEERRII